jgi:hypothetical protein
MMSAFGFAAFRSLARAFCFACASRELFAAGVLANVGGSAHHHVLPFSPAKFESAPSP